MSSLDYIKTFFANAAGGASMIAVPAGVLLGCVRLAKKVEERALNRFIAGQYALFQQGGTDAGSLGRAILFAPTRQKAASAVLVSPMLVAAPLVTQEGASRLGCDRIAVCVGMSLGAVLTAYSLLQGNTSASLGVVQGTGFAALSAGLVSVARKAAS